MIKNVSDFQRLLTLFNQFNQNQHQNAIENHTLSPSKPKKSFN